jgi:hypothetical protein
VCLRGAVAAVIEDSCEQLSGAQFPSLHQRKEGRAASSKRYRAATEADAAVVVFRLDSPENHPGLTLSGSFAIFYGLLGHPSLH